MQVQQKKVKVTVTRENLPTDLQDCEIRWMLLTRLDGMVIFEKTTADMIVKDDIFSFIITPEESRLLQPGARYYHEAQVTDGHGNVSPILSGFITAKPMVIT